jgi:glycosyltransferase involved in cell wall biosynthesis
MKEINFNVDGKLYSQRWVRNFSEVFKYPKPEISFFRGGFKEYDDITKQKPKHLGKKLYLATGRRIVPQWNGNYDLFLQEDLKDFSKGYKCIPYYKTASARIFYPQNKTPIYDICWPANFAQIRYKGHEYFIKEVGKSKFLSSLKIISCGNKPKTGNDLCNKYGVKNIIFRGEVNRNELNTILNESKFGLCMSNRQDGCPRVVTEILVSGTPLLIRNITRLLPFYKKKGVVELTDDKIEKQIKNAFNRWDKLKTETLSIREEELSFENICKKNMSLWRKI